MKSEVVINMGYVYQAAVSFHPYLYGQDQCLNFPKKKKRKKDQCLKPAILTQFIGPFYSIFSFMSYGIPEGKINYNLWES